MMNRRGGRAALTALVVLPVLLVLAQRLAPSPYAASLVSDVFLLGAGGWAGLALALRARRSPSRTSGFFAAYCLVWVLGQLVWTYQDVSSGGRPDFSAADVAFLAAIPLALVGALRMPALPAGIGRLRPVLDGLLVALSLLYAAYALVLGPIIRAEGDRPILLLGAAYPVADAVVIAVVAAALPAVKPPFRRMGYLLLAGLVCIALADSTFAYLVATGSFATGTVTDAGWVVGFGLIALSAALAPVQGAEDDSGPAAPGRLPLLTPYLFLLPALAMTAWWVLGGRALDTEMVLIGLASIVVMMARQIVTLLESEARADSLEYEATHDSLTGLWNRAQFRADLTSSLQERGVRRAVLFIDIDDFKDLNDGLGHPAGDHVLRCLTQRLCASVQDTDVVARLGGDEFGILLHSLRDEAEALQLAQRVSKAVSLPVDVNGYQHSLSISIGVALSGSHGDTAEVLLRNADLAMYAAKRQGKNCCAVYEPSMHASVLDRIQLAAELETAIAQEEFTLHYHPMYDVASGSVVGAEALLRWQHPDKGLQNPDSFVQAAERSGAILGIGRWALERACRFIGGLRSEDVVSATFELCVNVAPRQLKEPGFVDHVARCLAISPLQPHQLVIEVTESAIIDVTALPVLWGVKSLGVRIALDDFGAGYSSLSYLDLFPVDILKIGQSFIADIHNRKPRRAMVDAIITMAKTLGLTAIAEGIEEEAQLAALRELGCDRAQGHLLSRPVTEAELVSLLLDARKRLDAPGQDADTRTVGGR